MDSEYQKKLLEDGVYVQPSDVNRNDSWGRVGGQGPVTDGITLNPNDPMIDAQFNQAQALSRMNREALVDPSLTPALRSRRALQGPTRETDPGLWEWSGGQGNLGSTLQLMNPEDAPPLERGTVSSIDVNRPIRQESATRKMVDDPWATGSPIARAQAPDVANSRPTPLLPPARTENKPRPEVDSFFVLPQDARKREAFGQAARRDVRDLPPVSQPSGAIDPGSFTNPRTGERQSYGVGSPGDPQRPQVSNAQDSLKNEIMSRIDARAAENNNRRKNMERLNNVSFNIPTPTPAPTSTPAPKAERPANNMAPWKKRLGIGAAGTGLVATGAGIASLINNEREQREGGRN